MRIIAISTPKVQRDDAYIIQSLIDRGVHTVHLRKPESDVDECRRLLSSLGEEYRARIVIHNYAELYSEFSLRGIHHNRDVVSLPAGYSGLRTRSCHSLEEVVQYKPNYDYLFLSPIFDSISKVGYSSRFDAAELQRAADEGIIDDRVIALGGVTLSRVAYLHSLGFGGAAMCGAIYNTEALDSLKYLY